MFSFSSLLSVSKIFFQLRKVRNLLTVIWTDPTVLQNPESIPVEVRNILPKQCKKEVCLLCHFKPATLPDNRREFI
ncbi:hypothetical protein PHMEG_00026787 [Phytophthora megakarya]|uniref:Uncharacterized protein n=1 Tax=Phytophthora megakarya TaxID=4795 RepID=A0A225V9Y6_9STRA|nr:hypothetical protein PHMEG_00026787 [Phytophthora megakarya]